MDAEARRLAGPPAGNGGAGVSSWPPRTADSLITQRLGALATALRIVAEQAAGLAAEIAPAAPPPGLTLAEGMDRFMAWARGYYRKVGRVTPEVGGFVRPLQVLRDAYGTLPAAEFSLHNLKDVRDRLIRTPTRARREGQAEDDVPRLARTTVNGQVGKILRAFRWLASEELIPSTVPAKLALIRGLRRGRTVAREADPITSVEWGQVEPVLPHLLRQPRAIVELLWWTGARVNEICCLRPADVDRAGTTWLYRVREEANKTAHRGRARTVAIGPRGQAVLAPFLDRVPKPDPEVFVFSPAEAMAELNAQRHAERTLPPWPSHDPARRRERRGAQLQLGERYVAGALRRAVERACVAAGVTVWSPGQLRHSCATRLRRELGDLQAVACVLGHRDPRTTLIYAEADLRRAMEIAGRLG